MEDVNAGDVAYQEYPRDKTRPLNILHLPLDILYIIFAHLNEERLYIKYCVAREDTGIKTIQNARLVCGLFNRLASPLLCPVLMVELNQTSLNLVDEISRSPLIASGVRTIHVGLLYRPKGVAESLQFFKNWRGGDIDALLIQCGNRAFESRGDLYDEEKVTLYTKAVADFGAIISAWDKYSVSPADGAPIDAESLRHQEILLQGYEEYLQKQEEQYRLITDGSFVNTLASAMARMGHCAYVHFHDRITFNDSYTPPKDPALISTDPSELLRFLAAPVDWREIEEMDDSTDRSPARILSELPIAIHKAGAAISAITLHCFPTTNNYPMICPDPRGPNKFSWPDLRAACQHLAEFDLQWEDQPLRYRHLLYKEQVPIDNYLYAMLSGQAMEIVNMSFENFVVNDGDKNEIKGLYHIGTVLAAINWPRIKDLRLSYVSFHQGEVEAFFRGLDGAAMEFVSIHDVELLSGSWAGALDILRGKVAERCLDGKCEVMFDEFAGGEFGKRGSQKWKRCAWGEESGGDEDGETSIFDLTDSYVSGVGSDNPLSGLMVL
ncbi:hypothetical protein VE04_08604 [Pseudogymnoascus sp. 24MN13]|nr:hypothetical protein VE04_08604 [Pseudogymnoascus sp. 24MN13]